jgi:transposase
MTSDVGGRCRGCAASNFDSTATVLGFAARPDCAKLGGVPAGLSERAPLTARARGLRLAERQGRSKRGASLDPQGFDAGKKVTGRKRHILVDTLGLLLGVNVLPADIQDRDGARDLLQQARRRFPFVERIFADAGYQGPKWAKTIAATGTWTMEIVRRCDLHRFTMLPKRWIVDHRTILPLYCHFELRIVLVH